MKSKFNTVFDNIINEFVATANAANLMINNTGTSAVSSNTSSLSSNTPKASLKDTAATFAEDHLQKLQKSAEFWYKKADGLDELINDIKAYNSQKRLNALYGVIDYMKSKHPIVTISTCPFITNIQNKHYENKQI